MINVHVTCTDVVVQMRLLFTNTGVEEPCDNVPVNKIHVTHIGMGALVCTVIDIAYMPTVTALLYLFQKIIKINGAFRKYG